MSNKKQLRKIVSNRKPKVPLSDEEKQAILKFASDNPSHSVRTIGQKFNRDHTTILALFSKHKIDRSQGKEEHRKKTAEHIHTLAIQHPHLPFKTIAGMAGVPETKVRHILKNVRSVNAAQVSTKMRHYKLLDYIEQNPKVSNEELADKFGYTQQHVERIKTMHRKLGNLPKYTREKKPKPETTPKPDHTERNKKIMDAYYKYGHSEAARQLGLKTNVVAGVVHRHMQKIKNKSTKPSNPKEISKDRINSTLEKEPE